MERGELAGGTYRVIRPLGEGGTARVYLAVHSRTCCLFALKEIPLKGFGSQGELAYARHLSHSGLPVIHDLFEEKDCAYVVMDYISGVTLQELRMSGKRFQERELLDWMIQLTEILLYLHERIPPLIHGDVKPSNLMLDHRGKLVLVDFGACLVEGREKKSVYGTYTYASPEQRRGKIDIRSDIYSMGRTFLFLAGEGKSRRLKRLLSKCTMERQEARFQNCRELLHRLKRIRKRNKRICIALFTIALSLMAVGTIRNIYGQSRDRETQYQILLRSNQTNYLKSAIKSFPSREEAYQKLLQIYLLDQDFSTQESRDLEQILTETGNIFQKHADAYGEFCYDMGIAYWYYFQEQGGKAYAEVWFEKAAELLENKRTERAVIYQRLGEYYGKKARQELTGEGDFSWKDFLVAMENLCRTWGERPGDELSKRTQEEFLTQLYEGMPEFKRAGVEKSRIQEFLGLLRNLSPTTLEEPFRLAEESIETLYGDEIE